MRNPAPRLLLSVVLLFREPTVDAAFLPFESSVVHCPRQRPFLSSSCKFITWNYHWASTGSSGCWILRATGKEQPASFVDNNDHVVDDDDDNNNNNNIPPEITTKVLVHLFPAMQKHVEQYGNPNIPLGTPEGRQCLLLRRMHIQGKLSDAETELLNSMGFIFHTLEDVYEHADFDDMLRRLVAYQNEHGSLDVPKKYAPDVELGAWVTGVRRLGRERVSEEHAIALDQVGFLWQSTRKCGSKFMEMYRSIQQRLEASDGKETEQDVWKDPAVKAFVRAQKEAYKRQSISETRIEYMTRLLGQQWWEKSD